MSGAGYPSAPRRVPAVIGLRAPGRVNLIGDHTDYNDGFCLPLAIDRECVVTGSARSERRVTIRSRERTHAVDVAADGSDDPGQRRTGMGPVRRRRPASPP